jgi:hypothetical protein
MTHILAPENMYVGAADAAGLHGNQHLPWTKRGDGTCNDFNLIGLHNAHYFHPYLPNMINVSMPQIDKTGCTPYHPKDP